MATSGDDSKKQASTAKRLPPNAGKGRKKGVPNRITASVKEMILAALDSVGGEQYLVEQARQNPTAFLALIGRIIPSEVKVDNQPTFQFVNALPPTPPAS